ncbi:hypothetical protein GGX14DRAFT_604417 [Mycena pura]|uniref:Uncharacterized protein n=1 Tax=Mycena pura TaxID=153505 RepID=A0AAD6VUC5_9AGAR|nr:hypothetical protein GGX14DRAFT_604417 [Mycena pura]
MLLYIDGLDYNPPSIPVLQPSQQVEGLDGTGATVAVTIPENEAALADKRAHAIIVKAVPVEKLYVCQVMVQLYQKLRDADPVMMPDTEFAKHLVTLMTPSDDWRYCRDSLRDQVRQGEFMGRPLALSTAFASRFILRPLPGQSAPRTPVTAPALHAARSKAPPPRAATHTACRPRCTLCLRAGVVHNTTCCRQ